MDNSHLPAPRTQLTLEVKYRRNYARLDSSGLLKNISLSGAFLVADENPFRKGEKLTLTFAVAGRQRKISSCVVWTNEKGCGLRFLPTNNRDIQIIDDLIYFVESRKSGSRDLLDGIFKKVV